MPGERDVLGGKKGELYLGLEQQEEKKCKFEFSKIFNAFLGFAFQ